MHGPGGLSEEGLNGPVGPPEPAAGDRPALAVLGRPVVRLSEGWYVTAVILRPPRPRLESLGYVGPVGPPSRRQATGRRLAR